MCVESKTGAGRVIVSPVTDSGTVHAILAAGLVPVVADAAPGGYNTGLDQVTDCVTDLTAAVMLVHTAGEPVADTEAIAKLCENGAIPLIEDISQAMGANIDGQIGRFFWHTCGRFDDVSQEPAMRRQRRLRLWRIS